MYGPVSTLVSLRVCDAVVSIEPWGHIFLNPRDAKARICGYVDFAVLVYELKRWYRQRLTHHSSWSSSCPADFSKSFSTHGPPKQGPDELQRMHEIGNERAATLYGGIAQRPTGNASDAVWLKYLKEKYQLKKWASPEATSVILHETTTTTTTSNATTTMTPTVQSEKSSPDKTIPLDWAAAMDAFANTSTFTSAATAAKPKKDIIHRSNHAATTTTTTKPPPTTTWVTPPQSPLHNKPSHAAPSPRPKVDFFAEFGL